MQYPFFQKPSGFIDACHSAWRNLLFLIAFIASLATFILIFVIICATCFQS